jgi:hypothetical protein
MVIMTGLFTTEMLSDVVRGRDVRLGMDVRVSCDR